MTLTPSERTDSAARLVRALADPAVLVDAGDRLVAWNAASAALFGAAGLTAGVGIGRLWPGTDGLTATRLPLEDADDGAAILVWRAPEARSGEDAVNLQRQWILAQVAGPAWHEMANSLGGITSFASLLVMEGYGAADMGIDPRLIAAESAKIQRLSHTLTDLARWSDRPAPLGELVSGLVELAGHMLVNVDVSVAVPLGLPDPVADPARVRQVIAWLLLDAIRALGGPRGAARGSMRWSIAAAADDGAFLDVALEDDRPAPASDTTAADGWSVIRELVERDGGSLAHGPAAAGGARTVIRLAALAGAVARPMPAPAVEARDEAAAIRVLVCDDEEYVLRLLERILTREGMDALTATSGQRALELLDANAVDVVLADHNMPDMTGTELYGRARERHPSLGDRFILMSGDDQDPELRAFVDLHGLRLLSKPWQTAEVAPVVREVARR